MTIYIIGILTVAVIIEGLAICNLYSKVGAKKFSNKELYQMFNGKKAK